MKMILSVFNALTIFVNSNAQSQILKPVKWNFSIKPIYDCEAELTFNAIIDKDFHVYSQFLDRDDGLPPKYLLLQNTKNMSS
jgi:thiol:disulfide interchange protein DsbD